MAEVKLGLYKHYKGNVYRVLALARHSETLEEVVVYEGLYDSPEFGRNPIFVRPKKMFCESVVVDGKEIPRFEFVE